MHSGYWWILVIVVGFHDMQLHISNIIMSPFYVGYFVWSFDFTSYMMWSQFCEKLCSNFAEEDKWLKILFRAIQMANLTSTRGPICVPPKLNLVLDRSPVDMPCHYFLSCRSHYHERGKCDTCGRDDLREPERDNKSSNYKPANRRQIFGIFWDSDTAIKMQIIRDYLKKQRAKSFAIPNEPEKSNGFSDFTIKLDHMSTNFDFSELVICLGEFLLVLIFFFLYSSFANHLTRNRQILAFPYRRPTRFVTKVSSPKRFNMDSFFPFQ